MSAYPTPLEKVGLINIWLRRRKRQGPQEGLGLELSELEGKRLADLDDEELDRLYQLALEGLKNG